MPITTEIEYKDVFFNSTLFPDSIFEHNFYNTGMSCNIVVSINKPVGNYAINFTVFGSSNINAIFSPEIVHGHFRFDNNQTEICITPTEHCNYMWITFEYVGIVLPADIAITIKIVQTPM